MADDNYYTPVRNCLEVGRNQRFCAGAEEAARELAIKSATIKMLQAEVLERQSKLDEARKLLYEAYPWTSSDLQKAMDAALPKEWCDAYSASRPKPEAPTK